MSDIELKKNKQLICLVIPTLQSGGMERAMSELARYFSSKAGVELHLILYGKGREIFYKLPKEITVHQPNWPFDNSKRTWHSIKTLSYLRKTVKNLGPDVLLSFGEYWNSFVLIALFGLKYPVYVSDRCKPDKHLGRLHEFLRNRLYPGSAGIIAQTGKAKQVYSGKSLNTNIKVIGNPIRNIAENAGPTEKENIILTVGRLIDTKHHDRLIEIFDKVEINGWKLVIIGGDAIKQDGMSRLKSLIQEKGLQERVILTGTISDVESYYLKSKIFAFTSSSEGFPNVIGEAMSAGLPVVAYDCIAGPADMVNDGENGYLVDLFDDTTFEKQLSKLMKDEHLREKMGERSRELTKKFSVDRIGDKYYRFITEKI